MNREHSKAPPQETGESSEDPKIIRYGALALPSASPPRIRRQYGRERAPPPHLCSPRIEKGGDPVYSTAHADQGLLEFAIINALVRSRGVCWHT